MKGTLALVGVCLLVAAVANLAFGAGKEPKPGLRVRGTQQRPG